VTESNSSYFDTTGMTEEEVHAKSLEIIQAWPKVKIDFGDGTVLSCSRCKSTDIRSDPNDPYHWACAGCAQNSMSVSIFFPRTCACGKQLNPFLKMQNCPECGREIKCEEAKQDV
jgi:hypothetical protein